MRIGSKALVIIVILFFFTNSFAEADLLVNLDASELSEGILNSWSNTGALGGSFVNDTTNGRAKDASKPVVETVDGRKAVTFDGTDRLQSDFLAPVSLGNANPFTIAVWAFNPTIETNENILSWCDRYYSTADEQYGAFGWGSSTTSGAYYRYGSDLAYSTVPSAGQWHHITLTFSGGGTGTFKVYVDGELNNSITISSPDVDLQYGYPIVLGGMWWSNNSQEWFNPFSGSLASVQIYDYELSSSEIADLTGPALLVDLDAARLRFGTLEIWPNKGQLGGIFTNNGTSPEVEIIEPYRAVTFDGNDILQSDFFAPSSLGDTNPFTIAVWAYNRDVALNESMVNWCDRGDSPASGQYGTLDWGTNISEGVAYYRYGEDLSYNNVPSANTWHHIAVTYPGGDLGTFRVYVDGIEDNSLTINSEAYDMQSGHHFVLGQMLWTGHSPDWVHPFSGSLASVKIYNYELNQQEVEALAFNTPTEDISGGPDGPGIDITFFIANDQHYGVGQRTANQTTIDQMNALPGNTYLDGNMVNFPMAVVAIGDLTQDGLQSEWEMFVTDYGLTGYEGRLDFPVYEGWGNHDQHPGASTAVTEGIKSRNQIRLGLTNISGNGYHYSWDWDGVHFVMLNIYPGVGEGDPASWGAPMDSLPFLVEDLAQYAGDPGRAVVLFMHNAFDGWGLANWTKWEQDAFYDAIKNYNVIAMFGGHGHAVLSGQWHGIDYYEVAATQPLGGDNGFAVVHITNSTLMVANRLNASDAWGQVYEKELNLPVSELNY